MAERYSKGQVTRAGKHLAARLLAVRAGEREWVVDEDDPDDVEAREMVRLWRNDHVQPMLAVAAIVAGEAPEPPAAGAPAVAYRSKRLTTIVDKLTREPGRLTDMADLGGVRAVVGTQSGRGHPEVLEFYATLADRMASPEPDAALEARFAEATEAARPFLRTSPSAILDP